MTSFFAPHTTAFGARSRVWVETVSNRALSNSVTPFARRLLVHAPLGTCDQIPIRRLDHMNAYLVNLVGCSRPRIYGDPPVTSAVLWSGLVALQRRS